MSLMSSLYAHLTAKAGIAELIDGKMFPQIAPVGAKPHTVYFRAGRNRQPHSTAASGIVTDRVVFLHFAEHYDTIGQTVGASAVAEAFRNELDCLQRVTINEEIHISRCNLLDERDTLDPVEFAQSDAPHFVRQEYEITYSESLPTL